MLFAMHTTTLRATAILAFAAILPVFPTLASSYQTVSYQGYIMKTDTPVMSRPELTTRVDRNRH